MTLRIGIDRGIFDLISEKLRAPMKYLQRVNSQLMDTVAKLMNTLALTWLNRSLGCGIDRGNRLRVRSRIRFFVVAGFIRGRHWLGLKFGMN